jgi:hypothetical protein
MGEENTLTNMLSETLSFILNPPPGYKVKAKGT